MYVPGITVHSLHVLTHFHAPKKWYSCLHFGKKKLSNNKRAGGIGKGTKVKTGQFITDTPLLGISKPAELFC